MSAVVASQTSGKVKLPWNVWLLLSFIPLIIFLGAYTIYLSNLSDAASNHARHICQYLIPLMVWLIVFISYSSNPKIRNSHTLLGYIGLCIASSELYYIQYLKQFPFESIARYREWLSGSMISLFLFGFTSLFLGFKQLIKSENAAKKALLEGKQS